MKNIISILLFSFILCLDKYNYKIKVLNIPVADCSMTIKDTLYNGDIQTLMNFEVNSLKFYEKIYPVNNKYSLIINKEYSTNYFKKNTIQPQIINSIETQIKNDTVYYNESNYFIPENTLNIFSLLYLLMKDPEQLKFKSNDILEREGKFYSYSIFKDNEKYELDISPLDDDTGLIKHTDIFTWAIFKGGVKRYIYIDDNKIQKCVVKSGILNFTAEYIE